MSKLLDAETTPEGLNKHFSDVICDAMSSKHPELYSSFKVQLYEDN